MDPGQTASRFQTTNWTLIRRARASRDDLEALLGVYWRPVYAFLCRSGQSPEDAADLTQAFLSEVVLDRDLIGRADPDRGSFHSFLLASLKRFVVDAHRREHGRAGGRARVFVPGDPEALRHAEPHERDDPAAAFDRQWATTVLELALRRVEDACRGDGMERQWRVFERSVLRPALQGCARPDIEDQMALAGASERQEVYSMLQTVKRKLQREVKEVVMETLDTPREDTVDREMNSLKAFLALGS